MRPQWRTSTPSRGKDRLQVLLQEQGAEWEKLTRSLHTDQQVLQALEVLGRQLHRLLRLTPGASITPSPALAARLKARDHLVSKLQKSILLKEQQRQALERRIDQARLAVVSTQGHPAQGFPAWYTSATSWVLGTLARILRSLGRHCTPQARGTSVFPTPRCL
jgi:hypothetical protein